MKAESPLPEPALRRPLVGSVVQATAVLRHLGRTREGRGVNAIANALGISPSSCFNVLKTLASEGFLAFDPITKTYTLGWAAVEIARHTLAQDPALALLRPGMAALAERYDAAVALWRIIPGERLLLVSLSESEASTRIHMVIGQRQPVYAGATGRAVAAVRGLSEAELSRHFAALRWQRAPSMTAYLDEVAAARGRGWAVDSDYILRGITSIAVPVRDAGGKVTHSLSLSTFVGRHPSEIFPEIGEALQSVAGVAARH